MSIIKSQNARVMSEEAIQYLCKCINLVNSLPTSVIDNLHLADNLTFSSTKIDRLLTTLKEDCNKYTDSIVANLSRLELKVVTDEADMIEHNKLYLIKKAGETSYSQYVIVTNDSGVDEKILLGTCDISMTDYLKITDADLTYCKKTDFDALKTEVDKVKTTLGTKVNKTDIVTSVDKTSTDDKIPSAKAIYDKYSFHDLSEANTNVLDNALFVDTHNQNGVANKDCLVTSSSIGIPDNLLWGIRQVFWHADSDLVLKITGKDINNKGCIWINSLMLKDGKYYWQGWSKNVTSSGSSVSFSKPITIKQVNKCVLSDETFTPKSGDDGGGCVFTAPLGVKTVAFDLISNGILCQFGLCNMSGTLPTIITKGDNRIEYANTGTSGTYYIKNIKAGSNIYIGGGNGIQISNVRITEWY